MSPPQEAARGFADNPDHRTGSDSELQHADFLRQRHYNRVGQFPTTQTYRDPVQETVIRKLMNGHRKMKVTTTDENDISTTVFFDESASLSVIDYMAEAMNIRETRSRKGFRAFMKENAPTAVEFGDMNSSRGSTENTTI